MDKKYVQSTLISSELAAAISDQIGHELQASHQYTAIAVFFESLALKKLAKMFFKQGDEERAHAMKFVHYLSETGGKLQIPVIPSPKQDFTSVVEAVQASLDWEWEVTRRINGLMTLAIEEKDYLAQDFLRWFVSEQLEEVTTMENLLKIAKSAGEKNIIMLEAYLSHE